MSVDDLLSGKFMDEDEDEEVRADVIRKVWSSPNLTMRHRLVKARKQEKTMMMTSHLWTI